MDELVIHAGTHFQISQSHGMRIPGYLFVESRDGTTRLDTLTPEAARELGDLLVRAERIAWELTAPERVYTMRFGEENPVVHFHVLPRTKDLAAAYLEDVDDAPPLNGATLTAWVWRNHERISATDEEIHAFVERARALVGE